MADLIDRDELMRKHTKSPNHDNCHDTVEELRCLLDLIDNAPTIDAVQVVHGNWFYNNKVQCAECSICKRGVNISRDGKHDMSFKQHWYLYCPHCGAKMDEKEGEQNGTDI